jgi:hypothetical protein
MGSSVSGKMLEVAGDAEKVFMAGNGENEKRRAHELIEKLAPRQASAVVGLLEMMLNPISRAIANAPIDNEPLDPREEKALNEAKEWQKHNEPIPHEQVLADLGITPEELDRFIKST